MLYFAGTTSWDCKRLAFLAVGVLISANSRVALN